jgi:hypothetical protein
MAYDFDATDDILDFTAGGQNTTIYPGAMYTTSYPMTLACWARVDNSGTNIGSNGLPTATMDILTVQKTTANSKLVLQMSGVDVGDPFRATVAINSGAFSTGATAFAGGSTTGLTSNKWYHVAGVFRGTANRWCYVDGVSGVANTTSRATFTGPDWTMVGSGRGTLASGFASARRFNGKIAEAAVWDVELTNEEVMSLAKGACPTQVRPQSLQFYAPLVNNTQELMYARGFSGVGAGPMPAVFEHTRIFR